MSKARKGTRAKVDGVLHLELSARFAMEPASRMIAYNGRIVLETEEGDHRVGYVNYYVLRVSEILGKRTAAMEQYRWEGSGEEGRGQNGE
jgi:hypothetical protein